jgi:hypothetical protein
VEERLDGVVEGDREGSCPPVGQPLANPDTHHTGEPQNQKVSDKQWKILDASAKEKERGETRDQ